MSRPNIGVIGDRHAPFTHPDYLDFCRETFTKYRCTEVVDIGDGTDQHALNFHGSDPSGKSAKCEMKEAKKELARWYKAFPKAKSCIGNHDARIARRAYAGGIPSDFLRPLGEIYGAPEGWQFGFQFEINGVLFKHGNGTSGHNAAFVLAKASRQSVVAGHVHTAAGVHYHACDKDIIFGMNVGCGIERHTYAFAYGADHKNKPILGCGVVLENGTLPVFVPMLL